MVMFFASNYNILLVVRCSLFPKQSISSFQSDQTWRKGLDTSETLATWMS